MITLEDLAEELVGEITDEHDADVDPEYVPVEGDGVWEMAGDVHVDEVERALGVDLPRGHYETVAGFVIAAAGTLPEPGAMLSVELPPDPAALVVASSDPERAAAGVAELARAGVGIAEFSLAQPSLDEVFLSLTGHVTDESEPTLEGQSS